jgi:hypothetical protein
MPVRAKEPGGAGHCGMKHYIYPKKGISPRTENGRKARSFGMQPILFGFGGPPPYPHTPPPPPNTAVKDQKCPRPPPPSSYMHISRITRVGDYIGEMSMFVLYVVDSYQSSEASIFDPFSNQLLKLHSGSLAYCTLFYIHYGFNKNKAGNSFMVQSFIEI